MAPMTLSLTVSEPGSDVDLIVAKVHDRVHEHNGGAVEFYNASQDRWRLCASMWPKAEEGLIA